jgi:glutamate-ammonia-ligase adenylyltransferase
MTRARFVSGLLALQVPFDAVRCAVMGAPRDANSLKAEIVAMRDRVRKGHPETPGRFDVKHSPGAMVDVEFAVQYLVLLHTAAHPELADNVGNIELLQRAEAAGLLPPGMGLAAANAYRKLRRVQHHARLNEEPTEVEPAQLQGECAAVQALWQQVMG